MRLALCGREMRTQKLGRALVTLAAALASVLIPQICGRAQRSLTAYTPQVIKGPFTLVFSVRIVRPTTRWMTEIGQKSLYQNGTITVSSNCRQILYDAHLGNWNSVEICDVTTDTSYMYNNHLFNASIYPGSAYALASMGLLPMPGVGYDFYPMFQNFQSLSGGHSHGSMAIMGATAGGANGVIKGMRYLDTNIGITPWNGHAVLSSCTIMMPIQAPLAEEVWTFTNYRTLGSTPIAGTIVRTVNKPTNSEQWPPHAMTLDGKIRYTLLTSTQTALPDQQYKLETYLPAGFAITDYRNKP